MVQDDAIRYPAGRYVADPPVDAEGRARRIEQIAACPGRLADAIAGLDDGQLGSPYRPGGWTLRQVVHHLPDSHMNAYLRFKLALTEESPTIRPYFEDRFARLADSETPPRSTFPWPFSRLSTPAGWGF